MRCNNKIAFLCSMKLSLIRFSKKTFIRLQLHNIFGVFNSLFTNLVYMNRLSQWANKNRKVAYNDFPSKWDYNKRYPMYKWVMEKENLYDSINYLEFGVATGQSFRWFLNENKNADSRFYGFDTFDGLPEDWGSFKKGAFSNDNKIPEINDSRGKFYQGLFQQTVPAFTQELDKTKRNVLMMDADLYTATLYSLATMAPFLKKGDIIFFDEFGVPTHEFKAFTDFTQSFYINLELIAAANNYYFAAFKVV
jgi:O-methyltransferase